MKQRSQTQPEDTIHIYCDESCHLENDGQTIMVLGALWCPFLKVRGIAGRLREIKVKHGLDRRFEIKWTKVSRAKQDFYLEILDYFFNDDDLHFRALVVSDKSRLRHSDFGQDHDTWYYKMFFELLKALLSPEGHYRIFLDTKDTRSAAKVAKLHEVLCNNMYDFSREVISSIQTVRSHEVEHLQLADLLTGVISYANRGLSTNPGKVALVDSMRAQSRYSLVRTTLLREEKVNIFLWQPRED
ncbi:MAG: DUF3800 domain-containing protein [bacterium]|nr:DUF3800 domain-containing protein [bacterium]